MLDKQYDAVVMGIGGAGLAATVELVEKGKKVLALEKGKDWGGASKWAAEGIFAAESTQEYNAGNYMSKDEAFHHLMDWSHWRNNGRLVRKVVDRSAENIDWLDKHGMHTYLVGNLQDYHWSNPGTYHMFLDKFKSFDKLVKYVEDKGCTLLTQASGKKIIMNDGRVSGFEFEYQGKLVSVETSVVIVADGGFLGNKEMVNKYVDQDITDWYEVGDKKSTGDGINMVHQIGGHIRGAHLFQNHNACVYPSFQTVAGQIGNPSISQIYSLPLLWINRRGERFTDESLCYDSVLWGNVIQKENGKYFEVLDQKTYDQFKNHTVPMLNAYTRYNAVREFLDNLTTEEIKDPTNIKKHWACHSVTGPLPNMDKDFEQAIKDSYVIKANTIGELAKLMNVPETTLKESIEKYNKSVDNHFDPLFNKDPRLLQFKVEEGPFYAIRVRSAVLGTIGGIDIDDNCRAIGNGEQVIPGVYVVGANATGMYDGSYSDVEGVTCAFAWISGRIAAENATKYLDKKN